MKKISNNEKLVILFKYNNYNKMIIKIFKVQIKYMIVIYILKYKNIIISF